MKKLLVALLSVPYVFARQPSMFENSIGRIVDIVHSFALFFVRISPDYNAVKGLPTEELVSAGMIKVAAAIVFGVLIKEGMKRVPLFDEFEKKSKHTIQWVLSILLVVLTPVQMVLSMSPAILDFVMLVFTGLVAVVGFFILKHIFEWAKEGAGY